MVIKYRALDHPGGFYMYRIHDIKTEQLCHGNGFSPLKKFMDDVFESCPDEHFRSGPRSSALKFRTTHDIIEVRGHEVSQLAKYGLIEKHICQ